MQKTEGAANRRAVRFPVYEFLILFLPIAALVLLVGFAFISLRMDAHVETLLDLDGTRLHHIGGFIGAEVANSLDHLRSLATESATTDALDRPNPRNLQALEHSFLALARRNPHYHQVRWLDQHGSERLRIERDDDEPYAVAAADLQDKSDRYYVTAANRLLAGEMYVSRIDLNVERGSVELPPRPTLRVAAGLYDSEKRPQGVLVINIAMQYLFNAVQHLRQESSEADYLLVNREGMLLNGDLPAISGAASGGEQPLSFAASFPEVWEEMMRRRSGSLESWSGLWTWQTLAPVDAFRQLTRSTEVQTGTADRLISDDFSLTLVAHRPVDTLMEMRREIRIPISLAVLVGLAVYGTSLFLYLSGHVRERRAELNAAYAMARASQLERLKELEERFHALVDASSIGQLVVDAEGTIELCNRAAEAILEYSRGELIGKSVEVLLPDELEQAHVRHRRDFLSAPEARKMGDGRELVAVTKSGKRLAVEVGLNPYLDKGRQLVLASIIERPR
ncbi:MAG: PAS domain S-box protein [Chromatiaceae bacterium]|nr:PAS domain S-box protein [Chromatiaceae bacterium]MCP5315497.1 PAS domain S-box protein [Chromatiaceae bacterium]